MTGKRPCAKSSTLSAVSAVQELNKLSHLAAVSAKLVFIMMVYHAWQCLCGPASLIPDMLVPTGCGTLDCRRHLPLTAWALLACTSCYSMACAWSFSHS